MNESLVKYLAGLLDADGSLSFAFKRDQKAPDRYHVGLHLRLASSDAIDKNGFVDSLPNLTGFGCISRYGEKSQYKTWIVGNRADLEMILPRLLKHMVIKAKHWQWLLETWRQRRGLGYGAQGVNAKERAELTEASKESRKTKVGPLKPKNYPTWAWLAGYLDGDGWFSDYPTDSGRKRQVRVGAVAHENDSSVLEFLQNSFGGEIKNHTSPKVKIWYRGLGPRNASFAMRFLPKLARHSRLKRHKIDQMISRHRQRLSASAPTGEAIV